MTASTSSYPNPREHAYDQFEAAVAGACASTEPMFTTDADPEALWAAYLSAIPAEWRTHYDCHACRTFVKNFGGLVRVTDGGARNSAVWPADGPEFFHLAVVKMTRLAVEAKITGVFLSSDPVIGLTSNTSKKTGATWTHLHGKIARPWRVTSLTAGQKMAALKEDHGVLCRAFAEYGEDVAVEALRVLKSDALDRSSKAREIVEWYLKVLRDKASPARIWLAVATAPLGWCHIKNTVVSTLMDDIKNGVSFEVASKKWSEKMHPLQYMRPQAAPSDGAIERAEKVFEKLGLARSLERRFARLDEIPASALLWTPAAAETPKGGGVFGHLRTKPEGVKKMQLPGKSISVEAFVADVLPTAKRVSLDLGYSDNFVGVVAAVHADAPPILRWDHEDDRNPFSWYVYHPNSSPSSWGLSAGVRDVAAIFYGPPSWTKDVARRKIHETASPRQIVFVIAGARDSRGGCPALFPECLRGELHEVRSVIEAHNNRAKAAGVEEASANGIVLGAKASRWVVVDGEKYMVSGTS